MYMVEERFFFELEMEDFSRDWWGGAMRLVMRGKNIRLFKGEREREKLQTKRSSVEVDTIMVHGKFISR
jgi:hypothetical protein